MFFQPFFLHSAQRFLSATRFKSASAIALSSWGSASSPLFSACKSAKVCLKFSGHGLPHRNSNSNYMKQGRRRRHTVDVNRAAVLGCNHRVIILIFMLLYFLLLCFKSASIIGKVFDYKFFLLMNVDTFISFQIRIFMVKRD